MLSTAFMKLLKIILVLFLVAGLLSCLYGDKMKGTSGGFSRLRIAIDTNANFYLDSISLSAKYKFEVLQRVEYDSALHQLVYVFDSVENGELKFTLVSFLNRTFDKNISLQSDTTIFINSNELNNFTNVEANLLPPLRLNEGDTVVIGLMSTGCWHFYTENLTVAKNKGKYTVGFNSPGEMGYDQPPMNMIKEFDSSFGIKLNNFFNDCKVLLHSNILCVSTTSTFIFLRMGNSVYRLPDFSCRKWKGYEQLIKAFNPPRKKGNDVKMESVIGLNG